MKHARVAALAAALAMTAQPAFAAVRMIDRDAQPGRQAAFAGASLLLDLSRPRAKPQARLQLGVTRLQATGSADMARLRGLELGRSKGKAALYLNGIELREARQQLDVGGSTATYVLIGVGVLALVVLASVASAQADLLDTCDDQPECI